MEEEFISRIQEEEVDMEVDWTRRPEIPHPPSCTSSRQLTVGVQYVNHGTVAGPALAWRGDLAATPRSRRGHMHPMCRGDWQVHRVLRAVL